MGKVNVYEADNTIIARVEYNEDLDFWDGSNYTSGSLGNHLGITKLQNGSYVLIHGTQWEGEKAYADVVSDRQALNAILDTNHEELLEKEKFAPLKKLLNKTMIEEEA